METHLALLYALGSLTHSARAVVVGLRSALVDNGLHQAKQCLLTLNAHVCHLLGTCRVVFRARTFSACACGSPTRRRIETAAALRAKSSSCCLRRGSGSIPATCSVACATAETAPT